MRIETTDGIVFEGADAKEIVRKMRDTQWGAPVLKREYMVEVRDRLSGMPDATEIVIDSGADAFLDSLASNGLIRYVPDGEVISDVNAERDAIVASTFVVDDDDATYEPDPENENARVERDNARYEPDPRD